MAYTFKLRRDTAANWVSANSVLADGELGYETDTGYAKIGNGSTAWNRLKYFQGPPRSSALFDSTSDKITVTATVAAAGSLLMRFRPNWNHNDGGDRILFQAVNGGSLSANKYVDNTLYIGMAFGGDQRIALTSGNYAFNHGQIHTLVYTWSDTANTQEVFIDGVSEGTSASAFTLAAPTSIAIGNAIALGNNFNGNLYHAAMLDRIVTADEITDYAADVDPVATSGNFSLRFDRKCEDIWNARVVVPSLVSFVP